MSLQRPILTSFNGGELSPRMAGRVDTAVYGIGLEQCENFVPTVEGPIVKRPGFEFIRDADPSSTWLSTFKFNITQEYAVEWGANKLRFFTNGVRIETAPNVAYEVATPYAAGDARYVSQQQSFDRLYMDHASYAPAALTRTSAVTFAHAPLVFANGPFADANSDEAVTVTASAVTIGGAVTLTASAAIFAAGHVGSLFRVEAADFSSIPAWEAGIDSVVAGAKRRSDGKVYVAASNGRTGTIQPIHTKGTEWDGSSVGKDINDKGPYGVQWTYLHDRFGIVQITGFTSATEVTGTVARQLPDSAMTVATFRWAHSAFSGAKGWPNLVTAAFGRLIHIKDFDIVASVAGDFLNHAAFTASGVITGDLAFRRTIATDNPALWVMGDRKLLVGTASRELAVGAINAALAVSGDNISAEPQSFYGSTRTWPVQLGTSTFFMQRGGRKMREAQYEFGQDRYSAANVTVWARHITGRGVVQFAYQANPEELLFAVRSDGQIAAHPHQPEQQIRGFGRIVCGGGGLILSAVCIASADGASDELWALIQRGAAKSIERMSKWREDGDAATASFYVDGGVTGTATAGQTHFGPYAHLAGRALAVLADGGVVPGIVADAAGAFDIPATAIPAGRAYVITFGIPYVATATLLRPELKLNGETSQGKRMKVQRVVLRLLETLGLRVGALGGILDNLIDRPASANMDAAIPLFTGDSGKAVSGGWDDSGQATFISDQPLPATIICAMPEIDVSPPR